MRLGPRGLEETREGGRAADEKREVLEGLGTPQSGRSG